MDCEVLGVSEQPFSITHAEALLQYQISKGYSDWQLSPGKGYTFNDGVISITSKGKATPTTAKAGATGSKEA